LGKTLFTILFFLATNKSYCQQVTPSYIDSIIYSQNKILATYQYDYSSLEKNGTLYTRFELVADTSKKQLLKAAYTEERKQAFIVYYYFHNNKLIKVETMTRDEINKFPSAVYYFFNNKLVVKKGKNLSLQNEGLFKKISVPYILKQQDYLLSQFNYFINN
jgi:hypothetical protein